MDAERSAGSPATLFGYNKEPTTVHIRLRFVAACALGAFLAIGPCATRQVEAQDMTAGNATLSGSVVDQQTGLAIVNADVTLLQGTRRVAQTHTDAAGAFAFTGEPAGIYAIVIAAQGYQASRLADEAALDGSTTSVHITVPRATSSGGELQEIGRVQAVSHAALATTTVVNRSVSGDLIRNESALRIGDVLLAQPGLTSFNLDSAPGDDLNISIRGLRPSESQFLIDGHPAGPLGVFNGSGGGFNFQLSPSFVLSDLQIAYGTGGSQLLGIDAIAGTIDYRTFAPTARPHAEFTEGAGTQGRKTSSFRFTGTAGKLGYALASGVEGTFGDFSPQRVMQSGLLAGDASTATVANNTWNVSGNYDLRNSLVKLRYAFSPSTVLSLSGFNATSWDDKTGEGDNDFVTPEYAVYTAQQSGNTCTTAGGAAGFPAAVGSVPNACLTPAQYGALFSGPSGGSPIAWQALRLQDYDARLTTTLLKNNFTVEGFANKYYQIYNRNEAGFTNQYWTVGERITDDLVSDRNTFGFGYIGVHQLYTSGTFKQSNPRFAPDLGSYVGNAFLRDIYDLTPKLQLFANANIKTSSVANATNLDPRASFVYRPNGSDVYRVSVGRATDAPDAQLKSAPLSITTQPGALNPNCGGLNSIGSDANGSLASENAKEIELSYGHRFRADSQVQVVGYDDEVQNVVFSSIQPLAGFGPGALPANVGDYLARISTYCGKPASLASLGLTTAANAGAGRFRGIDVTGRYRLSPKLYVDYGYDMLSARYFGIPATSLQNNVTLIDGGQIAAVPFQKANLGVDYTFRDATELRLDGFFVGRNNALYRPPYFYADGFVSRPFGKDLTLNLGVQNLFNSQYDAYGRFGYATFQPENGFGTDANAIEQEYNGNGGERFGLPQRSFMLSLTARVR